MTDHSPTPWRVAPPLKGLIFSGDPEAAVAVGAVRNPEDAALIVRAVNAHDKALVALKDAQAQLLRLTSTVAPTDLIAAGAVYRLQIVIVEMEGTIGE